MKIGFSNIYEMPPIDEWDKSLGLDIVFGLYSDDVVYYVERKVHSLSGEIPHAIGCGVVADPSWFAFEPVVYAKIYNNGTVYAFTNANLDNMDIWKVKENNNAET